VLTREPAVLPAILKKTTTPSGDLMNIRAIALGLLLAASPAFAADIDGKWTGSIDTPNGPVQVNYIFKADGAKLTGTADGPNGSTLQLENGKVDGSKISYSLTLDFGQGPTTFNYTGQLAAGELKVHTEVMGQPLEFTLKKVK
jgi:hypothetical protein